MADETHITSPPPFRRSRLGWLLCALSAAGLLSGAFSPAHADETNRDGLFITVPTSITENAVHQIEQRVNQAVEREGRKLSVIVFDFNPHGKPAGTGNVFPCMQLKDFISRLSLGQIPKCPDVLTVAYIQDEVTDHTVLPVLACREIVMSSKGKLGHVLRGQDKPLAKEGKQAYEDVVKLWPIPGLLSKLMQLSPSLSMFDVDEAQKVGLCKARLESRPAVKDQYGLPPLSLREDTLEGRTPIVWRIEVHGALDPGKLGSLERRIKTAIRKKANTIILHLDCDGGETNDAASMAEKLRNLTDDNDTLAVKTIAYVPPGRSLGVATFLAVGCSEIVMAPDAKIGGFDYLKGTDPKNLVIKQKMLADLAQSQGYPAAFFQAMLDPKVKVYLCRRVPGARAFGYSAVLTDADLAKNNAEWTVQQLLVPGDKGEFFSLDAKTAQQYGIARFSDVTSPEQLCQRYGFDPTKVESSRDDWLDAVASFLREPLVNVLLIMIGVAGLILELKIPGFGVPGIVAALCFVLFFWAHAFAGQSSLEFTLLAVLLFILGLVLLGIEIFLLPGFGVTGISGIALIVISLVLVMLEQMPSTSREWGNMGTALMTVGVGLVSGMGMAIVIARYLPNIPYASRLVLEPPEDGDQAVDVGHTQEGLESAALLGAIGLAATTLRPSGTAQFGDKFLDVIAEGDYVNAGARVQVIEIEGNRIVVKEVV